MIEILIFVAVIYLIVGVVLNEDAKWDLEDSMLWPIELVRRYKEKHKS